MHLCSCTGCYKLYVDKNPQADAVSYSEDLFKYLEIDTLILRNREWICPECNTDRHLTDYLVITINRGYRPKLVKAAKQLDILIKEDAQDYEKIRHLLIDHRYPKDIYQFIEVIEVDEPNGRHLSHSEREKIGDYFNNDFTFCNTMSRDGKLYFGFFDGEDNDGPDGKIRTWGYITEEQINNILKPKPKLVVPKKNAAAEILPWYKKLMKNIH